MKEIPLTQGKVAIVDDADFDWLNQWKWYAVKTNGGMWYVRSAAEIGEGGKKVYMHCWLLGVLDGVHIDHKDGDGLNNQRVNLRYCLQIENMWNQKARARGVNGKTSRFRGVYQHEHNGKWRARLKINGRTIHIGYFFSEIEAAKAYDKVAIRYYGEFARLNLSNAKDEVLYAKII